MMRRSCCRWDILQITELGQAQLVALPLLESWDCSKKTLCWMQQEIIPGQGHFGEERLDGNSTRMRRYSAWPLVSPEKVWAWEM